MNGRIFHARRWLLPCMAILLAWPLFAQDTAYMPKDAQIPGPTAKADFPAWLADLQHWRRERLVRIGFYDTDYQRPELRWIQKNLVCVQMMIEERDFYNRRKATYTVASYLRRLKEEFGGVDSVLIWDTYPNLGVDDRNQFDRMRDMPGGLAAVKEVVAEFHRHGVHVLFPETPWDMGTRPEGIPDWTAQARLLKSVGADGLLGDTMDGMPQSFLKSSLEVQHPLALQPEGLPPEEALAWNEMSWGYWSYPFVPMISRYKWLVPQHMPVLTSGGRHHIDGIQAAFFNGVGYADQEDVIGIHNAFTSREDEALRRTMRIERVFVDQLNGPDWEPHTPTLQFGVFASRFAGQEGALWTIINRNGYEVDGAQLQVPQEAGMHYFDLWRGSELHPTPDGRGSRTATLSFAIEPEGFGAVLASSAVTPPAVVESLLADMKTWSRNPLSDYNDQWHVLPQTMIPITATARRATAPEGMVLIPGALFAFRVHGMEVAGKDQPGLDVQDSWENSPRRYHDHVLHIHAFYMDRYPVTNEEFRRFLMATHYRPGDKHNFLRDWHNGIYPEGQANRPVTWVSLEDARAYAAWAGKRLPHEWEWQYSAQGTDGRLYPWGKEWNPSMVPVPDRTRRLTGPAAVTAHAAGASPFGVQDLVGNVWQWTDEFEDAHTRTAILRGGSYYEPQGSMWYFPQAYRLNEHGKYLLMAPSIDRSGTIGFRCAADAP